MIKPLLPFQRSFCAKIYSKIFNLLLHLFCFFFNKFTFQVFLSFKIDLHGHNFDLLLYNRIWEDHIYESTCIFFLHLKKIDCVSILCQFWNGLNFFCKAVSWIKSTYIDSHLCVKTLNDVDFLKHLELAIQFGNPFLFENIDEELDPLLDPILCKTVVRNGTSKTITLGEKVIIFENFYIFLTFSFVFWISHFFQFYLDHLNFSKFSNYVHILNCVNFSFRSFQTRLIFFNFVPFSFKLPIFFILLFYWSFSRCSIKLLIF